MERLKFEELITVVLFIRETTRCLALEFSDFDTLALGFGVFVFF